ncbi:hypothetical protein ACHAWF_000925 [Thalassiosira exigua]
MTAKRPPPTQSAAAPSSAADGSPADAAARDLFPPASRYHSSRDGLARRRRWLVVDFDGTCTARDTTPLLPRLAALAVQRERGDGGDGGRDHERDLSRRLALFRELEDEYVRRYTEARSGIDDHASFHDYLDALDGPSNAVTAMVSESRVLEGLGRATAEDLEDILGEATSSVAVELQSGCAGTLARLLSDATKDDDDAGRRCLGWSVAVLSINWCPALIDASLVRPVLRRRRRRAGARPDAEVPVWCNRVDGEGAVALRVPGALAKRDRIVELRRRLREAGGRAAEPDGDERDAATIVYVGDSSTDLAALLEADVGILIGESYSTEMIAERWGIRTKALRHREGRELVSGAGGDRCERGVIWRAESWHEIDKMLIELDEEWP